MLCPNCHRFVILYACCDTPSGNVGNYQTCPEPITIFVVIIMEMYNRKVTRVTFISKDGSVFEIAEKHRYCSCFVIEKTQVS